jgi:hypothetical protein
MTPNTSPSDIFDDAAAAVYIGGITARTIRNWRTRHGLPFMRITAKVIRIRRAELDNWLDCHRVAMLQTPCRLQPKRSGQKGATDDGQSYLGPSRRLRGLGCASCGDGGSIRIRSIRFGLSRKACITR